MDKQGSRSYGDLPTCRIFCFPAHLVSSIFAQGDSFCVTSRSGDRDVAALHGSFARWNLQIYTSTVQQPAFISMAVFILQSMYHIILKGFLSLRGGIIRPLLASRLTSAAEVLLERRGRSAAIASTATSLPPVERSSNTTKLRWRGSIPSALATRLTARSRRWRWRRQLIAG